MLEGGLRVGDDELPQLLAVQPDHRAGIEIKLPYVGGLRRQRHRQLASDRSAAAPHTHAARNIRSVASGRPPAEARGVADGRPCARDEGRSRRSLAAPRRDADAHDASTGIGARATAGAALPDEAARCVRSAAELHMAPVRLRRAVDSVPRGAHTELRRAAGREL
ncbi:hypothetical protein FGB62_30g28 [Gracilaria domingensis]|nr:hypothetical protein FGB62_30g28 [Gracilaria domingensis]